MDVLRIEQLKKYYEGKQQTVKAVDAINLTVKKGEFLAIVGASGSGKTTLLNLIGGLDFPTGGKVHLNQTDIYQLNETDRTIFRRRNIGFIFQNYNLVNVLDAWDNIVLPIELDGRKVDKKYVEGIVHTLKLNERMSHLPGELSGGQQQRVAIARALASNPAIILADEPTGNLDSKNSEEVIHLLKKTIKQYNQTLLLITHEERIAQEADRVIRLRDGKIIEERDLT
ncbi:ABC transporter ATP-binding protein [Vallitalea pronyensis]|uniref:ABC transporter ATP-binding protein n=1 Tax=Vallitalea pronyensis TaxID=1348613 RepID=A0A8J8SFP3_9FIRM|nr:ABC transporter ATP-binding protein [Vallitalea pronyensis]QUI21806.1 ABC transporter ATP-binding protein [Vallitalea pronyensis]